MRLFALTLFVTAGLMAAETPDSSATPPPPPAGGGSKAQDVPVKQKGL